jgi:hypothetical protein
MKTTQVLKWIMAKVKHWNWLLKKLNVNVETNSHKNYEKKPPKTLESTTRCGYVLDGRNKIFQDSMCRYVGSRWMMEIFLSLAGL